MSFFEGLAASRAREAPVSRLAEEVPHALSVVQLGILWSLVSTADDQLTGTDGAAPELADILPQF